MKGGTTMRRLIIVLGVAVLGAIGIAAALAQSGTTTGAADVRQAAGAGDDTARVASALGLAASDRATLAKAQALGRQATRCLLAHGATQEPGGAVSDPTGEAMEACVAAIEANEAFLGSADFAAVLKAAQPKFEAAARCFSRVSGIPPGTIIKAHDLTPELQRRLDEAQSQCFRPDGLPR